jgi:hypothetical protein
MELHEEKYRYLGISCHDFGGPPGSARAVGGALV